MDCIELAWDYIDMLPQHAIEVSPVLLQASGEKRWLEGKLSLSAERLQAAVKLYVKLGQSSSFVSTFSVLAIVRAQLGQWSDTLPMLEFLEQEWKYSEHQGCGRTPLALSLAARRAGAKEQEVEWYLRSIELLRGQHLRRLALYAATESLLRPHLFITRKESRDAISLQAELAGMDPVLLRTLTERQFEKLSLADVSLLSHRHRSLLHMEEQRSHIHSPAALFLPEAEGIEDLEVRYHTLHLRHEYYLSRSQAADSQTAASKAKLLLAELPYKDIPLLTKEASAEPAVQAVPGWHVRFFGAMACSRQGKEITRIHWKRKKAQELFAYLLLQPSYTAVRDVITEALFPDAEPSKAANQLHVAAHRLRQVLQETLQFEHGLIITDGSMYLHPELIHEVDTESYTVQIRVANQLWVNERDIAVDLLTEARQLYAPLLPELPYSDWLERARIQFQELQCSALRKLTIAADSAGDDERVEQYATEWLMLDTTQEEAAKLLIRLYRKQGRYADAKACYEKLKTVLWEELGVFPSADTSRLYQGDHLSHERRNLHGF